ncbi:MAG: hypothetical protein U0V74_16965 [Chitinophagales bacterium]
MMNNKKARTPVRKAKSRVQHSKETIVDRVKDSVTRGVNGVSWKTIVPAIALGALALYGIKRRSMLIEAGAALLMSPMVQDRVKKLSRQFA